MLEVREYVGMRADVRDLALSRLKCTAECPSSRYPDSDVSSSCCVGVLTTMPGGPL